MNKITWAAVAALAVLLSGCAAPSARPGTSPTPTPTATATKDTDTDLGIPRSTNWVDLLQDHPVHADLIEAGMTTDQIAAQAAIRTRDGVVPDATVQVAFGTTSGGDLISTGGCKVVSPRGECPSEGILTGMLPIGHQQNGEPYRDYSKGLLIGFTADNNPFVIKDLTLKKR